MLSEPNMRYTRAYNRAHNCTYNGAHIQTHAHWVPSEPKYSVGHKFVSGAEDRLCVPIFGEVNMHAYKPDVQVFLERIAIKRNRIYHVLDSI